MTDLEKIEEIIQSKIPERYSGLKSNYSVKVTNTGVYIKLSNRYSSCHAIGSKDDPKNGWFTNQKDAIKQALIELEEYLTLH